MPDFYFRGSIDKFWRFTFAEYNRLSSIFGQDRFEIFSPDPEKTSLLEWSPRFFDQVHFIIWASDHLDFPVRLRASQSLGSELVEMNVSVYTDVLQKYGESVLDVWNSFITSLDEQRLLIKPAEFLNLPYIKQIPPIPPLGSDTFTWLDWRIEMLKQDKKCTLKDIAPKIPISYSRLRSLHDNFKKARGLANRYEKQYKKRYKK